MIYPHDNASQTRWDRGELQVQLLQHGNPRPIGYCDGTAADEVELRAIAQAEGAETPEIQEKGLKTGRQIWTLTGSSTGEP